MSINYFKTLINQIKALKAYTEDIVFSIDPEDTLRFNDEFEMSKIDTIITSVLGWILGVVWMVIFAVRFVIVGIVGTIGRALTYAFRKIF